MHRALFLVHALRYRSSEDIELIEAAFVNASGPDMTVELVRPDAWLVSCDEKKMTLSFSDTAVRATEIEAAVGVASDTITNLLRHVNLLLRAREPASNTLFHNFSKAVFYFRDFNLSPVPILHTLHVRRLDDMDGVQSGRKTVEIRDYTAHNLRMRTNDVVEFFHMRGDGVRFQVRKKITAIEAGDFDDVMERVWSRATPCEDLERAIDYVNALHPEPLVRVLAVHVDVGHDPAVESLPDAGSVQDAQPTPAQSSHASVLRKSLERVFGPEYVFITHDAYMKTMNYTVIAVIARHGKILASAANSPPIGPSYRYYVGHAEHQVISKLFHTRGKRLERKHMMAGLTLYVLRFTKDGVLAMARPCRKCSEYIRQTPQIARIVYSNDAGELLSEASQALSVDVPHSSAGRPHGA